jgi:DNA integrity scanning protein DisA with diadenylate cyclase activity
MDKRITIQNLDKIIGQHLFSKWLPKTTGWVVRNVESVGDTYIFELGCSKGKHVSVQLRRDAMKYEPNRKEFLYELWGWNTQTNKPEQVWCRMRDMGSTNDFALSLGMMVEKML